MTDKELDMYKATVEPNFDSHIERGTIEMNNEYFNLIEEKMARLISENQELKLELELYENGVYYSSELDKKDKEIEELKKQQEEFLELLEGMHFETEDKWWLKILEKYKEIIGDKE